jgi:hypothetical protein
VFPGPVSKTEKRTKTGLDWTGKDWTTSLSFASFKPQPVSGFTRFKNLRNW